MTQLQFAELVTQYEKLVYTICYQMVRDHHTAQDLAQETFLSAYRNIDTCPPEYIKPWLARIASNKAKDHLKSAYHRRIYATEDEVLPEAGSALFIQPQQPEDLAQQQDMLTQIRGYVLRLEEPYHKVSVLYFLEEKTVEEIAGLLDRPSKTVHTQLYRAKRMLQQHLKGDGLV